MAHGSEGEGFFIHLWVHLWVQWSERFGLYESLPRTWPSHVDTHAVQQDREEIPHVPTPRIFRKSGRVFPKLETANGETLVLCMAATWRPHHWQYVFGVSAS